MNQYQDAVALSHSIMIIYFTMSILSILHQAEGQNISIIRGENDVFTNLAGNVGCKSTKAVCFDRNCTYCKCERTNYSFVQSIGAYGECIPNEYLVYVTSHNSSFLVQDTAKKLCLQNYRPPSSTLPKTKIRYVIATKCKNNARSQRWFWTKTGQLLNLERLECITVSRNFKYLNLILTQCDVEKKRQLWKCCENDPSFLWQQESRGYLYFNTNQNFRFYYVLSYPDRARALKWKRFGLNRTICSIAVGCENFYDGSSMLILNKARNCEPKADCLHGEKEINIAKATECSLIPNQGQYLHKDQWTPLLVENEPFKIATSNNKTSLKWDLMQTPESWKGIIVKVQFQCKGSGDKQNDTKVYCILIKYTGRFTGFFKQQGENNDHRGENKSQTVAIIVSILVITLFVVIGLVLGYRNKNRLVTLWRNIQKPRKPDVTRNASPGQRSGMSTNPIYHSSDKHSAQNDCELYEKTEPEPVYSYVNAGHEPDEQLEPNVTYDYAVPDDHTTIRQQKIVHVDAEEKNAAQGEAEMKSTDQSSPVYQVLEKNI